MWRVVVGMLIACAWAAPCWAIEAAPSSKGNGAAPAMRVANNHWGIGPIAGAEQFPVALGSYCVVQLHDHGRWIPGRGGEATRFDGLEYRFDSSRDRHIFLAARETYVPMLGGDCPVTYADAGSRVAGKLEFGILHRRRLIFFADAEQKRQFESAPDKYENADLVLAGNSVVSMIDDRKCVAGVPATLLIHRGLRYWFANDYQRRLFLKHPGRYDGTGQQVERPNEQMESEKLSAKLTVEAYRLKASAPAAGFGGARTPAGNERELPLGTLPMMSGYCPVSLRQDGSWVRGRQNCALEFKDLVFLTASEREMNLLKSDPADYLPACTGECAVSLVDRAEHVRGSVFHAADFDGRLFLFADGEAKAKFKAEPAKYAMVDVAALGFCTVTLVDKEVETPGLQQFATWRDGKLYRFAGAAEKARFLATPERYAEDAE